MFLSALETSREAEKPGHKSCKIHNMITVVEQVL